MASKAVAEVSPAMARRLLRATIRSLRTDRGFSQSEVAKAMDWSLSKTIRIESGTVSISANDLKALLALCGETDEKKISGLLALAKTARQHSWLSPYSKHISSAAVEWLGCEAAASVITQFHPTHIPNLLQTTDYLKAVLRNDPLWSRSDVESIAELNEARKNILFCRSTAELRFIVDEAALFYGVDSRQIDSILSVWDVFSIGVLSVHVPCTARLAGPFTLYHFEKVDDFAIQGSHPLEPWWVEDYDSLEWVRENLTKIQELAWYGEKGRNVLLETRNRITS